ncbi:MAG: hypothetical protein O6763_10290 [Gammaproteobacteria bacterium]|nr:hypothetical protein [Gammaproteobacteria bacterium]
MIHLKVNLATEGLARIVVLIGFAAMLVCQSMSIAQAQDVAAPFMSSYETEDLGGGLYAFRAGVERSFFLVSEEGVVVIDPLNIEAAQALKAEITGITDQPVRYVVYSSSFFDRVAGGRALRDDGTQFVAHENCVANLRATPHPDIVAPDVSYVDRLELTVGEVSLELFYFGQSYGTCLSVMLAQPANVLFIMNLVNPPAARVPEDPTLANYYLHNIVPFFELVEALAAQHDVEFVVGALAIGSNGAPLPAIGPVSLITEQRIFWETLLDIVKAEYDKGTMARLIPKRVDMEPLSAYPGYDRRHVEIMMRRIYSLYRIGR